MEERQILFGKYEMGRQLGKGTFANVYYGKEMITGESVAIKVINKDQVKKEGMMDQIEREISVMRLVRHPNIVELKEVMATKKKIFFVMEHVKGGELFSKVAKGKLKEETARKYFQQLIIAVDYCHSRGVSHRDLKPENLLVDENEDLKISDFGLSALPEQLLNDGLLHTQCDTNTTARPLQVTLPVPALLGEALPLWQATLMAPFLHLARPLQVLLMAAALLGRALHLPLRLQLLQLMVRPLLLSQQQVPWWSLTLVVQQL